MSPDGLRRHGAAIQRLQRSGDVRDLFVLATPLDPSEAARFGSIEAVFRSMPMTDFAFVDGEVPVRLFRRR